MELSISRTLPLRHMLSRIGSATYRFNTALVGLDCIANGAGDGGAIAVTWTKPRSLAEAKSAAAQARSFACAGAIVLAADVFDSFLRDIAGEGWLCFSPETVEIATKAKTRSKDGGGAYSVAERTQAITDELKITDKASIALIDLFSKWRNVVTHSADRLPKLDPSMRQELFNHRERIGTDHAHLRIDMAIKNFDKRAIPVPKEVTSLIANAVRLARLIDEASVNRVAATQQQTELAATLLLSRFFRDRGIKFSRSFVADAWQGDDGRRADYLVKLLGSLGVSNSSKPVSAPLPSNFISNLTALSRDEFEAKFVNG